VSRARPLLIDTGVVALALLDSWVRAVHDETGLLVALIAALALIVRRRWPLVSFALTLPALFTANVLIAPLAALYTVAVTSRSRAMVLACAVITAAGEFLPWPPHPQDVEAELRHLTGVIFSVAYAAAPVALGFLVQTRRELSARLAELTAGREREQHLLSETVLAKERARLAREMHDVVSHKVSLVAVQAGALRMTATDAGVRESADTIRRLSVQTLEELRQMVGVLRADGGHVPELAPQPGLADVARLVGDSGLDATVEFLGNGNGPWPEPLERAAYRTVQEGLTNVSKHAPGAAVAVQIELSGHDLRVEVRNGPSQHVPTAPDLPRGGHGLLGLRERADLLGGAVHASPTDDGGFVVAAVFPRAMRRQRIPQT
jgi:signal transduction histidine kinase